MGTTSGEHHETTSPENRGLYDTTGTGAGSGTGTGAGSGTSNQNEDGQSRSGYDVSGTGKPRPKQRQHFRSAMEQPFFYMMAITFMITLVMMIPKFM
ncbi:hypothetical protein F4779DRAFT_623689 [Xylariaceae sp. FL0662B]|nr:hypothetical protein F4779DRAFT_623689 [Xylariaceae sp. FL0662B]